VIHPQRLVSGLVATVEGLGVRIYSDTPATSIEAGRVTTPGGTIKAGMVVGATEAYTDSIPGRKRRLLPFHSMMVATEPLSQAIWQEIGLSERETFGDPRRMVIYGQRTLDGRLAFGGRGAYFFGSGIRSRFSPADVAFKRLGQTLEDLFPVLSSVKITHSWGGALGIPRDWRPVVGIDRGARFAWAGGYVGEGVAATNLAGQTLADLILEKDSPLVDLAWVGPAFKRWEPEPLRWLGVAGFSFLGGRLDAMDLAGKVSPRLLNLLHDWMIRK
jgi:glycine/D-amino acid oxidase-like deaminating enzyme